MKKKIVSDINAITVCQGGFIVETNFIPFHSHSHIIDFVRKFDVLIWYRFSSHGPCVYDCPTSNNNMLIKLKVPIYSPIFSISVFYRPVILIYYVDMNTQYKVYELNST